MNYQPIIAFILALLCTFTFAGCAPASQEAVPTNAEVIATVVQPETTAASVSEEEMALMKCRLAIEDIQSYESYSVKSANSFDSEMIINDTSDTYYLKNGEDWVRYTMIPETGILDGEPVWFSVIAYMCADGKYYNTERDGYVDSDLVYHWGETSAPQDLCPWFYDPQAPWIFRFDWDAQDITFVSKLEAGTGESIRLKIHAPYLENTEESRNCADFYTAEIYFDAEGRFEKAVLIFYITESDGSQSSCNYTETIYATDPEQVNNELDYFRNFARNGCGDKTCTVCYE